VRNIASIDALFPETRKQVLAATLTRPEKWRYLSEIAAFLRTTPSSLQREFAAVVQGGILEQRRDGRRIYFKAETRSPIFLDLHSIFEKTVGIRDLIARDLADASVAELSADRTLATAYNAALQAAKMAISTVMISDFFMDNLYCLPFTAEKSQKPMML
jgi:DNA-binding transcriptional ArsR family regulator